VSTEPGVPEGLAEAAQSVALALAHVQAAAGAEVAAISAQIMIGLATQHLLINHGPVAARAALVRVYADLQAAIEAQNGSSPTIN
jgi:hypothetical protein